MSEITGHCSGNPGISVMVSWMYNNAKDVKTGIDDTLRVTLVKLENNNEKDTMAQRTKVSRYPLQIKR